MTVIGADREGAGVPKSFHSADLWPSGPTPACGSRENWDMSAFWCRWPAIGVRPQSGSWQNRPAGLAHPEAEACAGMSYVREERQHEVALRAHILMCAGRLRRKRPCGAELRSVCRGCRSSCRVKTGRFCGVGSKAAASEKRSGFAREEPWYLFSAGAGFFRRPINTAWAVLKLGHVRFWQNRPGGFANSGGRGRWPRIRIEPNSQAYWSPIGSLLRAESLVPAGLL